MSLPDDGTGPARQRPAFALARLARFLPLVVLLVLLAAALASGATRYLSLKELQADHALLQAYVRAHPMLSLGGYATLAAAVIALSLPGSLVVTLAGGYLFGAIEGTAAAVGGETVGAIVMYVVCRSAFGETWRRRAQSGGRVQRMAEAVQRHGFSYLLTLRLIPGVPFFLVNLAAAIVAMPLPTYVAATVVGIIPSTLIYTSFGSGIGRVLDEGRTPSLHMVLEPALLIPLIFLVLLAITPIGYHLWRARKPALPKTPG